jgi:hypothetical protein
MGQNWIQPTVFSVDIDHSSKFNRNVLNITVDESFWQMNCYDFAHINSLRALHAVETVSATSHEINEASDKNSSEICVQRGAQPLEVTL